MMNDCSALRVAERTEKFDARIINVLDIIFLRYVTKNHSN